MQALLNARAALLQAQIRLGHGGVYAALAQLRRARLVRAWVVAPGRRRGARARCIYELTPKGIDVAERNRRALRGVAGVAQRPDPAEMAAMRKRLREAGELSAAVMSLRDAMPR
jgi:DNA-binding PadR family transcriptional regulator